MAILREVNLKLKLPKYHFVRKSAEFLGHVLTPERLQPNPGKVTAVQAFSASHNVSKLRQFLGLTSYYRRFIANFSKITSPLHHLTKKEVDWNWTEDCQQTFDMLKERLISAPVSSYPNFDFYCVLETDGSIKGLGAILAQRKPGGVCHPIAYASRSLSNPKRHYSITELETLVVVWAIQDFRAYLYGHNVTVITDHFAVRAILDKPESNGKHAR